MEFLILFAIGFLIRGSLEHSKGDRARSRAQRVKEVAKSHPKGSLSKSQQKAAARRHATGWWAREIRHGFPVHRTGWHAAWLAHQTTADHHKARREEARTTALETRASVLKGMPEHKKRQAEAQKELDAIREQLAEWERQVPDVPPRGKRAVREAADEVARKRKEREQATGPRCPSCGAPAGYDHLPGCDPSVPPLPADSVPRPQDDLAEHVKAPMPDPRLSSAQRQRDQRGQRNLCAACGHPGNPDDELVISDGYRVHESHTHDPASGFYEGPAPERGGDDRDQSRGIAKEMLGTARHPACGTLLTGASLENSLWCPHCEDLVHKSEWATPDTSHDAQPINPTASPTTQGAPVTDTNYTAVLAHADQAVIDADQDAVTAAKRRQTAEQHAEGMQAANVQGTCLTAQMELTELHKKVEEATKAAAEQATLVSNSLKKEHGGIQAAVDDAPIAQPAEPAFYGGS